MDGVNGEYRCEACDAEFDEPRTEKRYQGEYHGTPMYEHWNICPFCGSDEVIINDIECIERE